MVIGVKSAESIRSTNFNLLRLAPLTDKLDKTPQSSSPLDTLTTRYYFSSPPGDDHSGRRMRANGKTLRPLWLHQKIKYRSILRLTVHMPPRKLGGGIFVPIFPRQSRKKRPLEGDLCITQEDGLCHLADFLPPAKTTLKRALETQSDFTA